MAKQKLSNGNYAAIDIGSNAIRLLIKRVDIISPDTLTSTKEQLIRVPLRLGFDVFTKGKISKCKEKKLCKLMDSFTELMKLYEVISYKACATAAIRDASNGKEVIAKIKKKTGVRIHILSGQEEAKLIYDSHAEFIHNKDHNFLYVDVGGGSTEVNLIIDSELKFSNSYNIGTIRILSDTLDPNEWNRMVNDLTDLGHTYPKVDILGSGGNINKLYRLADKRDKKQQRITVETLKDIHERICHLSLEERIRQYNLRFDRADVIVPASQVFLTIADLMDSTYIYVPTIGLSDGMIDNMLYKKLMKEQKKQGITTNEEHTNSIESDTATISANSSPQESGAEHPEGASIIDSESGSC